MKMLLEIGPVNKEIKNHTRYDYDMSTSGSYPYSSSRFVSSPSFFGRRASPPSFTFYKKVSLERAQTCMERKKNTRKATMRNGTNVSNFGKSE